MEEAIQCWIEMQDKELMFLNKDEEVSIAEIRKNFETRLSQLNQLKDIASTKLAYYKQPSQEQTYMNAIWSWTFADITISNLIDLWGFLQIIVEDVAESEEEGNLSKAQIQKLHIQFKKYSPILREFKEALDQSKRIRERFR
jgi:ABC-type Zn uptake system ZnuABC Zn-binding protein ZnuA